MKSLKEVTENLSYLERRIEKFDNGYINYNDPYEVELTRKYFYSLADIFNDIIRDFDPVVSDDCTELEIYSYHLDVARICKNLFDHLQSINLHIM